MGIKELFQLRTKTPNEDVAVPSANDRKIGETYQQWGTRWAGQTNATIEALHTALQVVILQQRKEQSANQALQNKAKVNIETEIEDLITQKAQHENSILELNERITSLENEKRQKQFEIERVKDSDSTNKIATINYYIGLTITLILAFYLFIFYSSASYQAFFGNDSSLDTGQAIFYPHAYEDALNMGAGPFLLILLMPVIFLGRGFLIHQFTTISNGITKYAKILLLYIITFIFDGLLAYEISEKIYNQWCLNQIQDQPPYSIDMAIESPAFWVIIFSGFIAYVIWGLVFDFTMDSYNEMTSNSKTIQRFQNENKIISEQIETIKPQISKIKGLIFDIDGKINTLQHNINNKIHLNIDEIIHEVNNFFNGWVAFMSLAGKTDAEKTIAQTTKENAIKTIKN